MNFHHQHNNDHKALHGKRLVWAIILNILITVSQVIGGLISGSLALLSDSLHNFSDVSSLLISYIANKLSLKKQTREKTFGYKRAEIIAAFVNAATLLIIAVFLVIEAIRRLANPSGLTIDPVWVISLAGVSIVANGISVLLVKKGAEENINMKSAYLHLFTDMLSSVAVLSGGIIIFYFNVYWVDSVLSILIAIYLVFSGWKVLMKSLNILMQFTPSEINIEEIANHANKFNHVNNLHHIHAWQLDDNQIHVEAHVNFQDNISISKVCNILQSLEKDLIEKFGIDHVTLQPEFKRDCDEDLISQEHQNPVKD